MSFLRSFFEVNTEAAARNGLFTRARYAWMTSQPKFQVLESQAPQPSIVERTSRILIVGDGASAMSLGRNLRNIGFSNVTFLTKSGAFGGKCVYQGCMPCELMTNRVSDFQERLKDMQQRLSNALATELENLGGRIVKGELNTIEGKFAVLQNGERLFFDQLVFAHGNVSNPLPDAFKDPLGLGEFWQLSLPQRILLVTDTNPAVVGLADLVKEYHHEVTVVCTKPTPLDNLPSFKHLKLEMRKNGVKIFENCEILAGTNRSLILQKKGQQSKIDFDQVINCSTGRVAIPKIDGLSYSFRNINMSSLSLQGRPDISFIGDAAGLMSASEAELSGSLLAKHWADREPIDHRSFELLPLRIHAKTPLAMVGKPLSYRESGWRQVDFKGLGWTTAHRIDGALWFLFNTLTAKVDAFHIYHPRADELIATARILLDIPIDAPTWTNGFVHPSSSEIFTLVQRQVYQDRLQQTILDVSTRTWREKMTAAPVEALYAPGLLENPSRKTAFYRDNFSDDEFRDAILNENPRRYFAAVFALRHLLAASTHRLVVKQTLNLKDSQMVLGDSQHVIPFKLDEVDWGFRIEAIGRVLMLRCENTEHAV
jgi:pyruvate/2-oxoglutarate dehydrogenase complex dihydrolipoamide dehydrogenase (E3) component